LTTAESFQLTVRTWNEKRYWIPMVDYRS